MASSIVVLLACKKSGTFSCACQSAGAEHHGGSMGINARTLLHLKETYNESDFGNTTGVPALSDIHIDLASDELGHLGCG